MKLNIFEWFKEANPNLVDKNIQVVRTTECSTILFFESFDNIHLEGLKRSDNGLLQLHASRITKVPSGYEVELCVIISEVSTITNPIINTRHIHKIEIDE